MAFPRRKINTTARKLRRPHCHKAKAGSRMSKDHEHTNCVICGQPLSVRELELCRQLPERFDHQLLCHAHQRLFCGCPGVRGQHLP